MNLGGDYELTPGGPFYLTAGPFDFGSNVNVALHFSRWLNTDSMPYADATVELSNDGGAHWSLVWSNGEDQVTDSEWLPLQYRLTAADRKTSVYVRWGYTVRDYAFAASGWNIGEVYFTGLTKAPLGTPVWWLMQYGLTNASWAAEELRDADSDGVPAWQEFLAGTDPTNACSAFRVLDIAVPAGQATLRFYGTTNSGVTTPFGMLRFTNLTAVGTLVDSAIARSLTGTNTWTDPAPPSGGPVYYRPVVSSGAPAP